MQTVEIILVRLLQLTSMLFFTFSVLIYVGAAILIPLAILVSIVNVLSDGIGFNGIFATLVAIPIIAWLGYTLYRIPNLPHIIFDTGWTLIKMGAANFKKFDAIARNIKGVENVKDSANKPNTTT